MKFYKSVKRRVEQDNYRLGVTRLDMNSGYYKTGSLLYLVSFICTMVIDGIWLFANGVFLLSHEVDFAKAQGEALLIAMASVFVALLAGFIFIKLKLNFIGAPLNVAAAVTQMIVIYKLYKNGEVANAFLSGIFNTHYFWLYFAPVILVIVFSLMLFAIYVNDRIGYVKDYNRSLASMLETYKEEHPDVTGIEWQQHLEELDAGIIESEKEKK